MAAQDDTENQNTNVDVNVNEETPLLVERQEGIEGEEEVDEDEEEKPTSHVRWYAWRVFWGLVIVVVIAVFVKGWIDAGGDVQVRLFFALLLIL